MSIKDYLESEEGEDNQNKDNHQRDQDAVYTPNIIPPRRKSRGSSATQRSESKGNAPPSQAPKSVFHQLLATSAAKAAQRNQRTNVIFLGRQDVGKSALLLTLQQIGSSRKLTDMENYKSSDGLSGIDYAYLNVRNLSTIDDDQSDEVSRCNIWVLQDPQHKSTLLRRLSGQGLRRTAAVICLNLERPWSLLEDLDCWMSFVVEITADLQTQLHTDEAQELKRQLSEYMRNYRRRVCQEESVEQFIKLASSTSPLHAAAESGGGSYEGPEREVVVNCCIPIIVVACKSDSYVAVDTRSSQGLLDVIQAYLRKTCLHYGAALIYASVKETKEQSKNTALVYRYLVHRLYHFHFSEPAVLDSKDALFLPSGWDTAEQLQQFASNTLVAGFEKPFELFFQSQRSVQTNYGDTAEATVKTEDMNVFLARLVESTPSLLKSHFSTPMDPVASIREEVGEEVGKLPHSPAFKSTLATSTAGAPSGGPSRAVEIGGGDSASLQTFFKGLLAKGRTKNPSTPRVGIPPQRTRRDRPGSVETEEPVERAPAVTISRPEPRVPPPSAATNGSVASSNGTATVTASSSKEEKPAE